ncbi:hypothetical protein AAE478_009043 [Parahypoxylon ruwenzoriense]
MEVTDRQHLPLVHLLAEMDDDLPIATADCGIPVRRSWAVQCQMLVYFSPLVKITAVAAVSLHVPTSLYTREMVKVGRTPFQKDPRGNNEMMLGKETITHASDEDEITIRRSRKSAFSHRSLLEQEPMMQEYVGPLMEQFENSANGCPVHGRKWFTFFMLDINSDFGFGEDMGIMPRITRLLAPGS